jgi:YebC/PmpR family DNA-binding regulatory protein
MSGHSKWAQIKRQKGTNDARKGQAFTKLGREISIAARQGGPDPNSNFRLRLAMQRARDSNMPVDNIDRAIKRATASGDGSQIEEITYEGYGPGGAALLVVTATDSRNRAVAEVRNAFVRGGGNLGESGSVGWLFEQHGIIELEPGKSDPDELALFAIDAGATDVKTEDGRVEVQTEPTGIDAVRTALEPRAKVISAETSMIAKASLTLDDKDALQLLKLMDRLEDLEDVQKVYTNAELTDEIIEKYQGMS